MNAPSLEDVDERFDAGYPERFRRASRRFWTPFAVAHLAASWLSEGPRRGPILDVGSGVGKFCIVGALTTGARFVGIEEREDVIAAARQAAERFDVEHLVELRHERLAVDWREDFTEIYLYNPFGENLFHEALRLDDSAELGETRFREDVSRVEDGLGEAPIGTRVVTFNGFGGRFPAGYVRSRAEPMAGDVLELWERRWLKPRRRRW